MNKLFDTINFSWLAATAVFNSDMIVTIISILSGLVILGFNIWRWVKAAKSDGKITVEEIEEGKEQIIKDLDNLKDKIDK